jgi:hypothetical protein
MFLDGGDNSSVDIIIDQLSYAMQDYTEIGIKRPRLVKKIVDDTNAIYKRGLFKAAAPETVESFLEDFVPLKGHDDRVGKLIKDIRNDLSQTGKAQAA